MREAVSADQTTREPDEIAALSRVRGSAEAKRSRVAAARSRPIREVERGLSLNGNGTATSGRTIIQAKANERLPSTSAREAIEVGLLEARALASLAGSESRLEFARTVVIGAVNKYWRELQVRSGGCWSLRKPPSQFRNLPVAEEAGDLAESIGAAAADLDALEAGYIIGVLYTVMMPDRLRSRLGAYYTPPALCERILDMTTEAGIDWRSAKVLDPACGGGAFLAPAARRMAASMEGRNARFVLNRIQRLLHGLELDPFAAWMSQVFIDATLNNLYNDAGTRLRPVVRVCNALEQKYDGTGFDLVVGNPPYGRITLPRRQREKFSRSLYGHANLYGLFTDLALRLARPGGTIAYVTPTSFLAGQYFKALRGLLGRDAPPLNIDFVEQRKGVFVDVLQETLLAVYRRGGDPVASSVHFISARADGSISSSTAGSFTLPEMPEDPWLMPRKKSQNQLVRNARQLPYRLASYGYTVSTGPLVWNRHKPSLRARPGKGRYPLIWSESIQLDGVFNFRAAGRNHAPYFEPRDKESWVVTDFPCVLLKRTTAKEQDRRLVAAELPMSFIEEHGAVVIENHLNMIRPIDGKPKVSPATLAALLNSNVVDQVFRCINGTVAVSAYELEALPLPSPKDLVELEKLVTSGADGVTLESAVKRMYCAESA